MSERQRWTLLAVSSTAFMLLLDLTIVTVALTDIQHALKSSFDDLQWVVDAYALTLAAFLLTAGTLADRQDVPEVRFTEGTGLRGPAELPLRVG